MNYPIIVRIQDTMKKIKDEYKQDTDGQFHHTEWDLDGHLIEVNSDEYGYHGRVDKDPYSTVANMNEKSFSAWVIGLLRRLRGK